MVDARRKEIGELEAEIQRLGESITRESVEVGRRIADLAPATGHEELGKYLNSIRSLRMAADGARNDIDRVRALTRRIAQYEQEIRENGSRRDTLLRERAARFSDLGAGAYTVYHTLQDREPYRHVFEELLRIDLEAEQKNEALRQLEEEKRARGFLNRLRSMPREFGLRGEISRLDRAKAEAFARAGEGIAASDFARWVEGPLRQLFDAIQDRQRAADALKSESERKAAQIESDQVELRRLGADDDPPAKIREIEGRLGEMTKEIDVLHCWTGQLFLERDLRSEVDDANLAAKFEIVGGLRDSVRRKRRHADRLRAETEIEDLSRREKERRGRRKALEEEIHAREREIAAIDVELNEGLRRVEELKRVLTGEAPYREPRDVPGEAGRRDA